MNRSHRVWLFLAGILAAVTATAFASQDSSSHATALKLLDATAATYRHVQSYREEGVISYETHMPGMLMRLDLNYTLAFRAPNLFYYERGPGMGTLKLVCDGKSFYQTGFASGQTFRAPAPADVASLLKHKLLAGYPPVAQTPPFDAAGLISGELDVRTIGSSVRTGLVPGSKWLASLHKPAGCRAIHLQVEGTPVPMVVWIDARTHAIRQVADELDTKSALRAMGEGASAPPPGMEDMFKGMVVRTVVTVRKVSINKPLPASLFTFKPAKGAKIVEVKSVDEIAGAGPGGAEPSPPGEEEEPPQSDLTGQAPIDLTAVDLDGKSTFVSSFKGKPLVLDFCATWCPPCRAELPVLDEAFGKYNGQGLQVVAVFLDQGIDAVKKFVAENKYHFTVLWLDPATDEGKRVGKEYGISGIPRTFYIGGDWLVKTDNTGFSGKDETVKALAALGFKSE